MSAAILDRARAFEMIANHLPEAKRTEVAEAIADKLLTEVGGGPTPTRPAPPNVSEPHRDASDSDDVVQFLTAHGWSGLELVKATVRLTEFLSHHKELTAEAGMCVWLGREQGTS